jgi:hypothetical protein
MASAHGLPCDRAPAGGGRVARIDPANAGEIDAVRFPVFACANPGLRLLMRWTTSSTLRGRGVGVFTVHYDKFQK